MLKIQEATNQEKPVTFKKSTPLVIDDNLHHLPFHNSLSATFITTVSSEKIITTNKAFCKLPGYSARELLTKKQGNFFKYK
jgi:hypothetical protein